MAFDKEIWEQRVKGKLAEIKQWLDRRRQQDLPYVVYGTVAGLTLWPIVEAAAQTGQLSNVMWVLFNVAGAIGGDLIASQLERWKDRPQPPTETEVADWVSTQVESQPELRQAIDAILEKLQALPQAQTHLLPADRAWFDQALQTELAQLGNLARFQAILTGQGQIVQLAQSHDNVIVGPGGVYVSDVQGNVYVGQPTHDATEALRIYRRVLAHACGRLPLQGVDVGASDPTQAARPLGLAQVYVALDTKTPARDEGHLGFNRKPETVPALMAAARQRRLVLLGDPGGGKSSFVNHLAHILAAHALQPEANWLSHLPGWPAAEAKRVPILVVLRDFARSLPDLEVKEPGGLHLWTFIASRLRAQNLAFAIKPVHRALEEGRALVLLDGLDEVSTTAQRLAVRNAVQAFGDRYDQGNRYLVTCRVLSYQPPDPGEVDLRLPLADFPTYELAPFDEEKIDQFITAWYMELARLGSVNQQNQTGLARQLQQAVRRPDLWRLAGNPLLLTVMALVHTHKGELPAARALLYEETVDMLLWRWEQKKTGGQGDEPPLRRLLLEAGRSDMDLKKVLWRLAFSAQGQTAPGDSETLADIGELALRREVEGLKPKDWNWAQQVIEAMKLRAGLLLERAPGLFTFPHRTFQEYLAGAHLSAQGDFARQGAALADEGRLWWEALQLAVGRLVYLAGDMDKPLALVGELCPVRQEETEAAWRRAWLSGMLLLEIGPQRAMDSALGRDLLARAQTRLGNLVTEGQLAPRERAAAGVTLARLGDPRPEVMDVDAMHFCLVPAADFYMGEGKESRRYRFLDDAYWLGQYPVTNAQYNAFVADGGYGQARYWQEAKGAGVWQNGKVRDWSGELRNQPRTYGHPYDLPNHPVVGVTWYEALAFSRWATERWRQRGWLPDGWQVTLPSEAEWEKAARGGVLIPAAAVILPVAQFRGAPAVSLAANPDPQRLYPWLPGTLSPEWANYKASDIGQTSSVGCFSRAASVYGCQEMLGNVWEWTRSWEKKYPYDPQDGRETLARGRFDGTVLRGGAFYSDSVRCPLRGRDFPSREFRSSGFRLALSPF
ncbi:MAG: hypothetical protein Fur0021_15800 [Candidatus Promineifilaceae bacterium]